KNSYHLSLSSCGSVLSCTLVPSPLYNKQIPSHFNIFFSTFVTTQYSIHSDSRRKFATNYNIGILFIFIDSLSYLLFRNFTTRVALVFIYLSHLNLFSPILKIKFNYFGDVKSL
ncbi:hypothetical protein L9F63_019888, partial [Diploptera punctata]